MELLFSSLGILARWDVLAALVIGSVDGVIIGAIPGVGAAVAIAILLPATFVFDPIVGLTVLLGIYGSSMYGGAIPAILINTPGTAVNALTTYDGYPMTQRGQARRALALAYSASFFVGIFSIVCLIFFSPLLAWVAPHFGSREIFLAAVLGMVLVVLAHRGQIFAAGMLACFGIFLNTVGLEPVKYTKRFTFDQTWLASGVDLIVVVLGLFAVAQAFLLLVDRDNTPHPQPVKGNLFDGLRELFGFKRVATASSGFGVLMGMIPGVSELTAQFMAYSYAQRSSAKPDDFGKGSPEGLITSEAANNAVPAAAMIPLLALGIPGEVLTAMMLSVFYIHSVVPGPQLFQNQMDFVVALYLAMLALNIIVGGGICGASTLYHLAKRGILALLVERKKLASGTTWHAAGIVGQLRDSTAQTELGKYTARLFRDLEEETGQATGYKQNGTINPALSDVRMEQLLRSHDHAERMGIETSIFSPGELQEIWPWIDVADIRGAFLVPSNGQVNPLDVTTTFVKGAKANGALVAEDTRVLEIIVRDGRVHGVETDRGPALADTVLLAGGMWSHHLAKSIGATVPLHAVEHFYIVTEPFDGLSRSQPILNIIEERLYFKEDAGKLLIGGFEAKGKAWATEGIPETFEFDELPFDIEHVEPELERMFQRMPVLAETGIQTFFNGPENFTPDGRPYLGPSPEVAGLFVAAGMNSNGILNSGGVGLTLAEWIANDVPSRSMSSLATVRAHPFQQNTAYNIERAAESIGFHYGLAWPGRQVSSARGIRRTPLHDRLERRGAKFAERIGWEVPMYFDPDHDAWPTRPSLGWQDWSRTGGRRSASPPVTTRFCSTSRCMPRSSCRARTRCTRSTGSAVRKWTSNGRPGRNIGLRPVSQPARRHRGRCHRYPPCTTAVHRHHRPPEPDPRPGLVA